MSDHASRRQLLIAGLACTPPGLAFAAAPPVVTMLGDSLTSGYGLPAHAALPAQLQAALDAIGAVAIVRGAGVAGDTTAGGLRRVDSSVGKDTRICVVALGGNDLLLGLEPRQVRDNLDGILQKLRSRRIETVLAGVGVPSFLGGSYIREFSAIFPDLARKHNAVLYPDLLAGIALDPRYNQNDFVHPNAAGVRLMAQRLAPVVAKALAA